MQDILLRFCLNLLNHTISDQEYSSPLISGLSLLGIDKNDSWHTAINYTPKLSGILAVARWFVLKSAVLSRSQAIKQYQTSENCDYNTASENCNSHFILVKKHTNQLLVLTDFGGNPKPWNWIYKLRALGMHIRFNYSETGSVLWNGNEVSYADISLSMDSLRSFIHGLLQTATERLYTEILFTSMSEISALPAINLAILKDNPIEQKPGFSFLNDERNQLNDGQTWLYNRILSKPELITRFINTTDLSGQSLHWKPSELTEYFKTIRQFKSELLVLFHILGGGPGRGPEVLSTRYKNTTTGGTRNLFIENGLITFITGYHKRYSKSRELKVINRFLPVEVSILTIYYIYLVIPLEENMEIIHGFIPSQNAFLWPEKPAQTNQSEPSSPVRKRLRRFTNLERAESDSETETSNTELITSINRFNLWTPGQFSVYILTEFQNRLHINVGISKWRHIYTAVLRRYCTEPELQKWLLKQKTNTQDSDFNINSETDQIHDLQAGHTTKISGQSYGRLLIELPGQTESRRLKFRLLSCWLHRFYTLPSAINTDETRFSIEPEQYAKTLYFQRWQRFKKLDLNQELSRYFGPDFMFRGRQKDAIQAILNGTNLILTVMPTGAGKSLLFMLPVLISGHESITIVVIPLISLCTDLKQRCLSQGIKCIEWNSRKPADNADILLIVPESINTTAFTSFIQRQKLLRRLDRIIIDECHVIFDSSEKFRPKIRDLNQLPRFETQLIYLTATLPVKTEAQWFSLMGIDRNRTQIIRTPTTRPNIQYSVVNILNSELYSELQDLITSLQEKYTHTGIIIVYCGSIKITKKVAEVLNCPGYYNEMGTNEEKSTVLQQLKTGITRIIAATNALGLGINIPNIRAVIHVGILRELRDYVQESGRAGRDFQPATAVILRAQSSQYEASDITGYINTTECRRKILDLVMDGNTTREKCEETEEICDICEFNSEFPTENLDISPDITISNTQPGNFTTQLIDRPKSSDNPLEQSEFLAITTEQRYNRLYSEAIHADTQPDLSGLNDKLRHWQGGCAICFYITKIKVYNHFLSTCSEESATEIRKFRDFFKKSLNPQGYKGCLNCWLPYPICDRFEIDDDGNFQKIAGKRCQFYGVLLDAIAVLFGLSTFNQTQWLQNRAIKYGIELNGNLSEEESLKSFVSILGRKVKVYSVETMEIVVFFNESAF